MNDVTLIDELWTLSRLAILCFVFVLLAAILGFVGALNYAWAGAKKLCRIFMILAAMAYFGSTYFQRRTH
jgi:hypothetical protein